MSDFKNYNGGEKNANFAGTTDGAKSASGEKSADGVEKTANLAAAIAKAFNGKSQKDIWQTILAQVEQGKRDGTLTNADLDNFYNTVAPLLDGYKRQKLKGVIAKLKAI